MFIFVVQQSDPVFSIIVYRGCWVQFSILYGRASFIHLSTCVNTYVFYPSLLLCPSHPPPTSLGILAYSLGPWLCFPSRCFLVLCLKPHIQVIPYAICLFLSTTRPWKRTRYTICRGTGVTRGHHAKWSQKEKGILFSVKLKRTRLLSLWRLGMSLL